jgi:hypothetical protein
MLALRHRGSHVADESRNAMNATSLTPPRPLLQRSWYTASFPIILGCGSANRDELLDRIEALEASRQSLEQEAAFARSDLDIAREDIEVLTARLAAAEAAVDVQATRLSTLDDDLYASIVSTQEIGVRLDDVEEEVIGASGVLDESRVDALEDEVYGTGSGTDSRLDEALDVALAARQTTDDVGAVVAQHETRINTLESGSGSTEQGLALLLDALGFPSAEALSSVVALLPDADDCADGEVLVFAQDTSWFECAPPTAVGRVLGVTTQTNGTPRDFNGQIGTTTSFELERFTVDKVSPTSVLVVTGVASASGFRGVHIGWRYGTTPEVAAQPVVQDQDRSFAVQAVLAAPGVVGENDMVLRAYWRSPDDGTMFFYNPDNRYTTATLPSQSSYVVWEIEP